MLTKRICNVSRFLILVFLVHLCGTLVLSQAKCLSDEEIKKIVAEINSPPNVAFNPGLQQKLLDIKDSTIQIYQEMYRFPAAAVQSPGFDERLSVQRVKNLANFCQILRDYGWTSRTLVGSEGSAIAAEIFLSNPPLELQQRLNPILAAAFKAGEISKSNWAKMVDQLRVSSGRAQVFGTAMGISKDLLLLYAIENEAEVDKLRREYELPPLSVQIRRFEQQYQAVVIKTPTSLAPAVKIKQEAKNGSAKLSNGDGEDVLQIETNLVSLNATVLPEKPGAVVPPLNKSDFVVLENGSEQSIEYFAATQTPFDITLLIDISGSTANKNKLIRKTTRSFIRAARPSDRISVVVFDQEVTVLSPLTQDREKLLASVEKIENGGGSKVWDALNFALTQNTVSRDVNSSMTDDRRSAIVFMTDGADNAFVNDIDASTISFADLLEKVRQSSTLVVPIHLDTRKDYGLSQKLYYGTRRALNLLADESGGLFYEAKKFEDLEDVYGQVINDLSKIYSIGYSPADVVRDGQWRVVKIKLKNPANLIVRSRKGYYAR